MYDENMEKAQRVLDAYISKERQKGLIEVVRRLLFNLPKEFYELAGELQFSMRDVGGTNPAFDTVSIELIDMTFKNEYNNDATPSFMIRRDQVFFSPRLPGKLAVPMGKADYKRVQNRLPEIFAVLVHRL